MNDIKTALENIEYKYFDKKTSKKLATDWYEMKNTTRDQIQENKPEHSEVVFRDNKFRLICNLNK